MHLTAIGNDNRGNLIGFTSAHCGGPGAQVGAEGAEASGVLGTMVAGNDALDYAVIQFDPAKVTPVNNVDGFQIDGLGPDPAAGEVACKLGRTTGYRVASSGDPARSRARSSARCAASRATPARRSRSTTGWSA